LLLQSELNPDPHIGHDVAGDLAKHNVDVTMVQRSPTHIMSNESMRRALAAYSEDGPPTHVADLLTASMSAYLTIALSAGLTAYNMEQDKYVPFSHLI
jgi:cation diffusion facilitator CzcD-associated flavoprotein CzcO